MNDYLEEIINGAHPLVEKEGIGPLIASIKDKKIVMLGEASHGTKEFYEWRQLITQELIMNHGFNFVAVEGDWPPCQKINRFVSAKESGTSLEVLTSFKRWPTWMWSNHEVLWFVDWLNGLEVSGLGMVYVYNGDTIYKASGHRLVYGDPKDCVILKLEVEVLPKKSI